MASVVLIWVIKLLSFYLLLAVVRKSAGLDPSRLRLFDLL